MANGTSTVALLPGSLAALAGYRSELEASRHWALLLAWPSLSGGLLGASLVVLLPSEVFDALVPWLILTAATLFALQPRIALDRHRPVARATHAAAAAKAGAFQFCVAVYGGYFGAGIGILMLTALALIGLANIHQMNALKSLLGSLINAVSAVVFIWQRQVHWPFAAAMAVSSVVGGYLAARVARRFNSKHVRALVVSSASAWRLTISILQFSTPPLSIDDPPAESHGPRWDYTGAPTLASTLECRHPEHRRDEELRNLCSDFSGLGDLGG